jgi:hypothetical protein
MNKKQLLLIVAALGAICAPVQAEASAQTPWHKEDAFWGLKKGQAAAAGLSAASLTAMLGMLATPSIRRSLIRAVKAKDRFNPKTTSDFVAAGLVATLGTLGAAALISTPFLGTKAGAADAAKGSTAEYNFTFDTDVSQLYGKMGDTFEAEEGTNAEMRKAIVDRAQTKETTDAEQLAIIARLQAEWNARDQAYQTVLDSPQTKKWATNLQKLARGKIARNTLARLKSAKQVPASQAAVEAKDARLKRME